MERLARMLFKGREVDPSWIAYWRGYYAGAKNTVLRPQTAAADLERAARDAFLKAHAEETEEPEQAPYF